MHNTQGMREWQHFSVMTAIVLASVAGSFSIVQRSRIHCKTASSFRAGAAYNSYTWVLIRFKED
jgi:hypothetical protein